MFDANSPNLLFELMPKMCDSIADGLTAEALHKICTGQWLVGKVRMKFACYIAMWSSALTKVLIAACEFQPSKITCDPV